MFLQPAVPAAAPGASKTQPSLGKPGKRCVYEGKGVYIRCIHQPSKSAEEPLKWPTERGRGHSAAAAAGRAPAIPSPQCPFT